jgi:hypothetical protein
MYNEKGKGGLVPSFSGKKKTLSGEGIKKLTS